MSTKLRGEGVNNSRSQSLVRLILLRPASRVGDRELQGTPCRAQPDFAGWSDVLHDVRNQFIDDQCQRNGHVSRHIYAVDIGRDPIWTPVGSADLTTQIVEEGVETHDAHIFAHVETLMHGRNREDAGSF